MAKRKIIWSKRALFELKEILEYFIVRNGSKTYSLKLHSNFKKSIRLLADYPDLGFQTDFGKIRVLFHGIYEIFYEVTNDAVLIISIWDTRQDPEKLRIS